MKFFYLQKNSNFTVLNMGYKLDFLQPKQEVFWHLTYIRSEINNAWKFPHEVMKFVYLHTTYVLSVLIVGLTYLAQVIHFVNLHSTYILSVHSLN